MIEVRDVTHGFAARDILRDLFLQMPLDFPLKRSIGIRTSTQGS